MIEGDLPGRAQELVEEWAKAHQAELRDMWLTRKLRKLPGLE